MHGPQKIRENRSLFEKGILACLIILCLVAIPYSFDNIGFAETAEFPPLSDEILSSGEEVFTQDGSNYIWTQMHRIKTDDLECIDLDTSDGHIQIVAHEDETKTDIELETKIVIKNHWMPQFTSKTDIMDLKENLRVSMTIDDETFFAKAIYPRRKPKGLSDSIHFTVSIPAHLKAMAKTSDGHIHVAGIKNDVVARTSDGHIHVNDVTGDVSAKTSDGHIHSHDCNGVLRLETSDGHIETRDSPGPIHAKTSDGHIKIHHLVDAVDATTSDGSITVSFDEKPKRDARFKTSDGSINIAVPRDSSLHFDLQTRDGRVNINNLLGDVVRQSEEKKRNHIIGTLNGGTVEFVARTSDGSITLKH